MDELAAKKMQNTITDAMKRNDAGLILMPAKEMISAVFWQRNVPDKKTMALNFVGGVAQNCISRGDMTKVELMEHLEGLLK